MSLRRRRLATVLLLVAGSAFAQERGFAVHRLDVSAPGSQTFLLDRPWYSATRWVAAGLTADYAHRVLLPQRATGRGAAQPIIDDAVTGQLDVAGAAFDRVRLTLSLPVALFQTGTPEVVSGAGPLTGVGVGDPRVGLMVRVFGDADRDAFSLHLGVDAWLPIGGAPRLLGDLGPRAMPRLVAAGAFASVGRWTFEAGYVWRTYASVGPPALGMTAAPELRVGLAVGASLFDGRLSLGPEARFSTQTAGTAAFAPTGMDLELLAGAHVWLGDWIALGVAGGTSFFPAAGAPDARGVVRLAFAPRARAAPADGEDAPTVPPEPDRDGDGVPDAKDRCPFEPETPNGVRDADGCPEHEGDAGAALAQVLTRAVPPGVTADAGVTSNPWATADSDADGMPDALDRCPLTPEDVDAFEDDDGCPELDNDDDGIADARDGCPNEAETFNALDDADGCPDAAPDADADGVSDAADRCPLEPETADGVRDHDGCPEPVAHPALPALLTRRTDAVVGPAGKSDSDGDGFDDDTDACPLNPEDADGFEDDDGCPEADNDDDGIADAADECPLVAETVNGSKDTDGCPDEPLDADGDSVAYDRDRCPLEPGDAVDGCPHLPLPALALPGFAPAAASTTTADFDRDGVPDDADKCPVTAEDADRFEDEDGCPEPDNDADGIDDAADKCPFAAETINGNRDDDGCPDLGAVVVRVVKGAVVLDETVQFKTASATLQPASFKLLKQVAAVLRAERALSIEIQGHTDDVGSAFTNITLSQKRAEAIRAFLVKAGVSSGRLRAKGFGPTRPRATNATAAGREQNRRVEFLILGAVK